MKHAAMAALAVLMLAGARPGLEAQASRQSGAQPPRRTGDSVRARTPRPESAAAARPLSPRALRARRDSLRVAGTLDLWIVQRFRGVQLLRDTVSTAGSIAAGALLPRIEAIRSGARSDTLFAVHFAARAGEPALGNTGVVRLAEPTGSVSALGATVLARRPFRAPRAPGANNGDERDWRYGWAYVVALPRAGRTTPATTFRGWLLIDPGTPK